MPFFSKKRVIKVDEKPLTTWRRLKRHERDRVAIFFSRIKTCLFKIRSIKLNSVWVEVDELQVRDGEVCRLGRFCMRRKNGKVVYSNWLFSHQIEAAAISLYKAHHIIENTDRDEWDFYRRRYKYVQRTTRRMKDFYEFIMSDQLAEKKLRKELLRETVLLQDTLEAERDSVFF